MQHRHRARVLALGEAGGVLERVDGRAPDGEATRLQLLAKLRPPEARLVEEPPHHAVDGARHLGPCVDATEPQQRVRAHLRRLAGLRHQAFAEAHHDGVVLGQLAREVPEAFAHHVGRDRVGGLLHLVEDVLVDADARAELSEEPRAQGRRGRRHRQTARRRAWREAVRRDGLLLCALDLDVFEPEVKPAQHRSGVEGPLRHQIPPREVIHGPSLRRRRAAVSVHAQVISIKSATRT